MFTVLCSHYIDIDLPVIIEGFVPGYTDTELDEIEKEPKPLMRDLVETFEEQNLPKSV